MDRRIISSIVIGLAVLTIYNHFIKPAFED